MAGAVGDELRDGVRRVVRRFDTKANIKSAKKNGIEFDPETGGGIPTTTTDVDPVDPDTIRELTGARNADAFMDIDITGKPTLERRTKAGLPEIVVKDNIAPEDIIQTGRTRKGRF